MAAIAQSVRRSAIGLGLFAVITGGTIAVTQVMTADRIAEQAARAEAKALFEIIPESRHDNDLLRDTVQLPASDRLSQSGPITAWVARSNGQPVGVILPAVAPDGYSGDIRLLVGIDLKGNVLGVRVTSHRETPGLGDGIETKKSDWIYSFEGRSLGDPAPNRWNVKKNGGVFDQFTGATITPRAVVKAVQKTLIYFRQNRHELRKILNEPPEKRSTPIIPDAVAGQHQDAEHS
ncbi:electron transport complex subunit RsxG [Marinobacter sp. NP-4(2019)]|uniref:electron transport complex subunit RsxG n=1 Tax=Marinobacter sp. NP-4(2019) TaxID=2488665 RepID=UPI000FC3F394|nr:electron transport complex subunit RsxG [Marinobacter sp. NP-4(2019)]AZT83506.1 electron transport complex subunit RsxG [Marinobacter sp. NP-4(2019)]